MPDLKTGKVEELIVFILHSHSAAENDLGYLQNYEKRGNSEKIEYFPNLLFYEQTLSMD